MKGLAAEKSESYATEFTCWTSLADLDRKLFFIRDYHAMSFSQFDLKKLAALKAPITLPLAKFEQDAVEATDRLMAIATRAPAS